MREPVTLSLALVIACGGAFGAVLRFLVTNAVSRYVPHTIFPLDTIVVNMLGAVLLAVMLEYFALRWHVSTETRAFILFGIVGGFTTFSRFTMDIIDMLEQNQWLKAGGYVTLMVFATVLAGYGTMRIMRMFLGNV